jgi:phosphate transport system substrate-binding protein
MKAFSPLAAALPAVGAALALGLLAAGGRVRAAETPVRLWGDNRMGDLVLRWEAGFLRTHPAARFENKLMGSDTGLAGLYTETADIAFLGRDITPVEVMAFAWVYRYKPEGFPVMHGSLSGPGQSPALAVIVHRDNPIASLTLAQLDQIFSCAPRHGGPPVHAWGELGSPAGVPPGPIMAYARAVDSGTAAFFRDHVMRGGRKWAWDRLKEFSDRPGPDGSVDDADRQIAEAVAADRAGIGLSTLRYVDARVRVVPVRGDGGGTAVAPTAAEIVAGRYPLARTIFAYVNRGPSRPLDPRVADFLRYVLSSSGRSDVAADGEFLPLSAADAMREQARLDRTGR